MKIKVTPLSSGDILSQRIGEALLHSRICAMRKSKIAQESENCLGCARRTTSRKRSEPKNLIFSEGFADLLDVLLEVN